MRHSQSAVASADRFGPYADYAWPAADWPDRRRSERREVFEDAYIRYRCQDGWSGGQEKRQCLVLDQSEIGARLRLDDPEILAELPKFFQLHTSEGVAYLCELKRRESDHVGVEFLHRA